MANMRRKQGRHACALRFSRVPGNTTFFLTQIHNYLHFCYLAIHAFYSNFLIAFSSFTLPVEDCSSGSRKLVDFNRFSKRLSSTKFFFCSLIGYKFLCPLCKLCFMHIMFVSNLFCLFRTSEQFFSIFSMPPPEK